MRRNAQEEGPANCCKFQIAARSKDLIGVFKKHIISQPPIQSRFYEKKTNKQRNHGILGTRRCMCRKKGAFSGEISSAKQLWKHIFQTTETKDARLTILDGRCLFFFGF